MSRRPQPARTITVYESDMPELAGVEFESYKDAAEAEDRLRKQSDPMGALDPIKQEEARQAQADAAARTAGDAAAAEYSKAAPAVATYKANKPLVEMEDKQAMDQIAAAGAARKANPITLDESSGWGGGPSMRSGSGADSVAKFAKIQAMSPQERERAVNEKFALPETTQEILARGDELNTSLRGKAVTEKAGGEDLRSVARSYNVPAYEQTSPAAAGVMKDIGAEESYTYKETPEERAAREQALLNKRGADAAALAAQRAADALKLQGAKDAGKNGGGDGRPSKKDFTQEQQLRTQFGGLTKDYRNVKDAFNRVKSAANNPSAAGDLSLVFNYMKMLDPGSTVREGEFANAQNATGVPQRVLNTYSKLVKGERLAPEQRKDFLYQTNNLFTAQEVAFNQVKKQYSTIATKYGLDPEMVVGGFDQPAEEQDATLSDTPKPAAQPAPSVSEPRISSKAEFDALPSGSYYISATTGKRGRKP